VTNIIETINDPKLLGTSFEGDSWETWRAILSGAFALPMTEEQTEIFRRLSGGREPPEKRVSELWIIAGRRSAKTKVAAAIQLYLGTIGAELDGFLSKLSPGERGVVALMAVDRQQAKVAAGYARGMIEESPIFSGMVERHSADSVDLSNRVSLEVHTSSYRAIRGRTLIAALFDEAAFWRSELTANPDREIYRAAVPALATTGGMLIGISSPYAKRGLLYDKYRKHYGKDGDVLVIQGGTLDFNPLIKQHVIDDHMEDDPEAAQAEWLGQFRNDVEAFVKREVVEQSTRAAPLEIPYNSKHTYFAFTDPSGGGGDEFTLAIGHLEGEQVVADVVRGRRGVPATIAAEYAELLKAYGLREVTGDKYAGSWPSDEFRRHGINYKSAEKPKSELYLDSLAALNSGRVELPPDDRLANQFVCLERRTSRAGKDTIDHMPGGNDDRANAIAGLIAQARKPGHYTVRRKSKGF